MSVLEEGRSSLDPDSRATNFGQKQSTRGGTTRFNNHEAWAAISAQDQAILHLYLVRISMRGSSRMPGPASLSVLPSSIWPFRLCVYTPYLRRAVDLVLQYSNQPKGTRPVAEITSEWRIRWVSHANTLETWEV